MLARFIVRALFAALGLWISTKLVRGVRVDGLETLIFAALLLGIVNAFIRPIIVILTLPLTIVTLGLFLLVVNAGMILLVSALLRGFQVHGFGAGILAAVITGITSWIGHLLVREGRRV